MMDAGATKKKGAKAEFEDAIKSNEGIRSLRFHIMNFDELEECFETNISDSKFLPRQK